MSIGQASLRGLHPVGFDLGGVLEEAVRGLPAAWRGAWGAMLAVVASAAFMSMMVGMGEWTWLGAVSILAAGLALKGALLRIALNPGPARPQGLGPAGLQLGRVEARLLGAALLCLLLILMIASVLGLVLLALAGMAELDADAIAARRWAAAGEGWKLAVVALAGMATLAILAGLTARLSLYGPATVARGRMTSLDSLALTRGATWPLLAGLVATAAPVVILTLLSGYGLLSGSWGAVVWALGLAGLQAPLTIGLLAAAYRRLGER